jgi:hypothetical protein
MRFFASDFFSYRCCVPLKLPYTYLNQWFLFGSTLDPDLIGSADPDMANMMHKIIKIINILV